MRLPSEGYSRTAAVALSLLLAGCGASGADRPSVSSADSPSAQDSIAKKGTGPEADYPVVLGEAYKIDGIEYVPADVWNYDEVGYATLDPDSGVTVSHRTLPLPSYVEVTSLENGRTILARVERRGPMTNSSLVGLSAGAQAQLAISDGAPIRVRRVNPPESERVLLRMGQAAPERLDTPMSLVAVLKRKLPKAGSASLAKPAVEEAEVAVAEAVEPAETTSPSDTGFDVAMSEIAKEEAAPVAPSVVAAEPAPEKAPPVDEKKFVIQAAAFASKANAERAAKSLEGFVEQSGRLYRVRTGPYATRGQANTALAKVKAAGYSDAQVVTAG